MKNKFGRLAVGGWLMVAALLLLQPTMTAVRSANGVSSDLLAMEYVGTGQAQTTAVTHAGDARLFTVGRDGKIGILDNGSLLPTPFLDLSAQICDDDYQAGLLGLTFHPNYAQNGYFFVNYTAPRAGFPDCSNFESMETRVSRFRVSADPNVADSGSEVVVLRQTQFYGDNNGGDLAFGPDGFLYIPLGDGGSTAGPDPTNAAQRLNTWLGKVLRIAPSVAANPSPTYTVPATNPYVGTAGALPEIWARGLRNPWRFSFDRLTGDMYLGDVGEFSREEIDFQPEGTGGLNYGWHCYEGTIQTPDVNPPCTLPDHTPPIYEYPHPPGIAVTGGYVYRGSQSPELYGGYFFGDFASGQIWKLVNAGGWQAVAMQGPYPRLTLSTFGEGADGELYAADYGSGDLYRLRAGEQLFLPLVSK